MTDTVVAAFPDHALLLLLVVSLPFFPLMLPVDRLQPVLLGLGGLQGLGSERVHLYLDAGVVQIEEDVTVALVVTLDEHVGGAEDVAFEGVEEVDVIDAEEQDELVVLVGDAEGQTPLVQVTLQTAQGFTGGQSLRVPLEETHQRHQEVAHVAALLRVHDDVLPQQDPFEQHPEFVSVLGQHGA